MGERERAATAGRLETEKNPAPWRAGGAQWPRAPGQTERYPNLKRAGGDRGTDHLWGETWSRQARAAPCGRNKLFRAANERGQWREFPRTRRTDWGKKVESDGAEPLERLVSRSPSDSPPDLGGNQRQGNKKRKTYGFRSRPLKRARPYCGVGHPNEVKKHGREKGSKKRRGG